jgi:phosphoglycolate phosphatase-like HAD superfamily hydrolase
MEFNGGQRPTIIKGVIFDMDGTLTEPGSIDFAAMYSRNGLQRRHGSDILTLVNGLPTEQEREAAMQVILEEEVRGVERMMLRPHLHTLIESLCTANIRTALSTRNCLHAYDKFIERSVLPMHTFVPALHRDSLGGVNKPDPAVARHILDHWEIETGEEHTVWFVGDSMDDMLCGRHAGCRTCLITTHENGKILQSSPHLVDLVVEDLLQLRDHFVGGNAEV